jgi:molybdopterin-guanine dinucleotide biosynthesis protein A
MPDPANTTLAILAGGESRRMGLPKTSLKIKNQPILQYLLESWRWPGPTLLITAPSRRHPPGHELFDAEATDSIEGQGPLRGIQAALNASTTDSILIVTVDMPAIQREQLFWILQQLSGAPHSVGIMLQRNIDFKEQIEPFPFACKKTAAKWIEFQLATPNRSVAALASFPEFALLSPPQDWPAFTWTNLNSPQDFQLFLAGLI